MKYISELQNNPVTLGNYQNMRSADGSLIFLAGNLDINLKFDGENVNNGFTLCEFLYVPFVLGGRFLDFSWKRRLHWIIKRDFL